MPTAPESNKPGKTEQPQKTAAKPVKKAASKAEAPALMHCMYLGPNLADGSLRRGQTFIRGIPKNWRDNARIRELFIPVKDLPQAKRDLKDPASRLARRIAKFVDPTIGGNS